VVEAPAGEAWWPVLLAREWVCGGELGGRLLLLMKCWRWCSCGICCCIHRCCLSGLVILEQQLQLELELALTSANRFSCSCLINSCSNWYVCCNSRFSKSNHYVAASCSDCNQFSSSMSAAGSSLMSAGSGGSSPASVGSSRAGAGVRAASAAAFIAAAFRAW
jgi:hypothetical protein